MLTNYNVDLDVMAASFVNALPKLDSFEQRLSLELYRLLAGGQPVLRTLLAERLGVAMEKISPILKAWPGVFFNSQDQVIGLVCLGYSLSPTVTRQRGHCHVHQSDFGRQCASDGDA